MSSMEAETRSLSNSTKGVIWLRHMLNELGWTQDEATLTYEDNKAVIFLTKHGYLSEMTSHLTLQDMFCIHHIKENTIYLEWMASEDMAADIFTKPLPVALFEKHRRTVLNM